MASCVDCAAQTSGQGKRCRSCAAVEKWKTMPRKRPWVMFEGIRYFEESPGSYWRSSRHAGHVAIHRAVWVATHGAIGPEIHVHHIDGNRGNNDLGNLQAMEMHDHHSIAHAERGPCPEEKRAKIGASNRAAWAKRPFHTQVCDECGSEYQTRATRGRFCSPICNTRYWNRPGQRRARVA